MHFLLRSIAYIYILFFEIRKFSLLIFFLLCYNFNFSFLFHFFRYENIFLFFVFSLASTIILFYTFYI